MTAVVAVPALLLLARRMSGGHAASRKPQASQAARRA
jgi:hypothetical protein